VAAITTAGISAVYHAGSAGLKACTFYNDAVGLSLHPDRLKRYKDVARLLYKYGRTDLVSRAGLDDALAGETLAPADQVVKPDELAADLERLGPAFSKLGQLLSTRADLLPPAYLEALGRLQDNVEPFSCADVERPGRVNKFLDAATNNELKLKIEVIDEGAGFAMVFFLVAPTGAIWQAWTILSSDRPTRRR
jgi:hypothetical protein